VPADGPTGGRLLEAAYTLAGGALGVAASAGRILGSSSLDERLGHGDPLPEAIRPLWFHGASVGELATIAPLAQEIRRQVPGLHWGVTTTTTTGRAAAAERLDGAHFRRLLPLDAWPATDRFLDRIHPGALIIVETEIWPRLLIALERRRVPVCLASARLTAGSTRRYRRVLGLVRRVLRSLDLVAARSDADRRRFLELGVDPDRILVLGNTKLDALPDALSEAEAEGGAGETRYSRAAGDRHLVVWGCHRPGEDELAVSTIEALGGRIGALWVVAPRHLPDFDRVAGVLSQAGVPFVRWSTLAPEDPVPDGVSVILVDTLGELRHFYAAADVAVVGGTFGRYGGHNLMEPAVFGVPVFFGTDTSSWPEDAERLLHHGGGARVHGPRELAETLVEALSTPETRRRMGRGAREAAEEGRGASARIADALGARGFFEGVTRDTPSVRSPRAAGR
jgi:3-deoxy-D-manno-octulosonic-acid transferase